MIPVATMPGCTALMVTPSFASVRASAYPGHQGEQFRACVRLERHEALWWVDSGQVVQLSRVDGGGPDSTDELDLPGVANGVRKHVHHSRPPVPDRRFEEGHHPVGGQVVDRDVQLDAVGVHPVLGEVRAGVVHHDVHRFVPLADLPCGGEHPVALGEVPDDHLQTTLASAGDLILERLCARRGAGDGHDVRAHASQLEGDDRPHPPSRAGDDGHFLRQGRRGHRRTLG